MARNEWASTGVTGLRELNEALKELPDRIAKNVLRGATAAGAAVIRKEAKLRAPVFVGHVGLNHPPPGTLKRAVYQKQIRELSSQVQQTFFVSVRTGSKKADKQGRTMDAYYWRFVEFGTAKMAARPFMRPAFEAKKMEAVEAIREYMSQRLPKEVEKLKKGPRV